MSRFLHYFCICTIMEIWFVFIQAEMGNLKLIKQYNKMKWNLIELLLKSRRCISAWACTRRPAQRLPVCLSFYHFNLIAWRGWAYTSLYNDRQTDRPTNWAPAHPFLALLSILIALYVADVYSNFHFNCINDKQIKTEIVS